MSAHVRNGSAATVTFTQPQQVVVSHQDDSIRLGDGTSLVTATTVGSDVGIDVNVIGGTLLAQQEGAVPSGFGRITITDTPSQVPSSLPANALTFSIRIVGTAPVYFGTSNSVSSTTGYPKFQYEEVSADFKQRLWAVCASGQSCEIAYLVGSSS